VIVIVNGAFGVGKTTVVERLRARLPQSGAFDPERVGYVLRRLPGWLPFSTRGLDDYQDSPRWRSLAIRLASRAARRRTPLLVPICVTKLAYLDEMRRALEARGHRVVHLCLVASEPTIVARLRGRGVEPESDEGRWVVPRARRACALHAGPEFAAQVPTEGRTPDEVAADIHARIGRAL
jgi:hypothetical protein